MPGFSWPFGGSSQSDEQSTTQDYLPNGRSHSRLEIFKDLNGFLKERNSDEGSDQERECDVRDLNPFDIIYIRDKTDDPSTDASRLNHRVMLITRMHEGNGMTCLPFRRTSNNRPPKGQEKHLDVVQKARIQSGLQPVQSLNSTLKDSMKLFVELGNDRDLAEGLVLSVLEPWHVEYDLVRLSFIGYVPDASWNTTIDKLIALTIQTFNVLRIHVPEAEAISPPDPSSSQSLTTAPPAVNNTKKGSGKRSNRVTLEFGRHVLKVDPKLVSNGFDYKTGKGSGRVGRSQAHASRKAAS